jgi:hypothetical protein
MMRDVDRKSLQKAYELFESGDINSIEVGTSEVPRRERRGFLD